MNLIDLLVLLLFVVGLVAEARAGFLGTVLGLIGAVGGFALALVAAFGCSGPASPTAPRDCPSPIRSDRNSPRRRRSFSRSFAISAIREIT